MKRINILRFRQDYSNLGYYVSLQICDHGELLPEDPGTAWLPIHPELESSYQRWKTFLKIWRTRSYDDWGTDDSITTNISVSENNDTCLELARELEENFQEWLQNSSDSNWCEIKDLLTRELAQYSNKVRLVIKADPSLRKLPWEEWSLLKKYPTIELILSLENNSSLKNNVFSQKRSRVDILAILGNSQELNLQPDREALKQLERKGASVDFVESANARNFAREFIQKLRRTQGWSILFFAGHSGVKNDRGKIYLDEQVYLEVDQFKNALSDAVNNGLKIAIFNSCQGFDLASEAVKLNIAASIYMQEEIPDRVAQSFSKYLLSYYSDGLSLYDAFRKAKSNLEEFTELPGIKCLPKIIYRNPMEEPYTWKELQGKRHKNKIEVQQSVNQSSLLAVMMISILVSVVVTGLRSLGFLEHWELQAYDHLMRMRPDEGLDSRLLLVTVDAEDVAAQPIEERKDKSISDRSMEQLLQKLEQYQPRLIGLDVYRENPVEAKYQDLANRLRTSDRIIAMCQAAIGGNSGYRPPPEVPTIPLGRFGFNNVSRDKDGILRRHLLASTIEKACPTDYSLSFELARQYLLVEGIELTMQEPEGYFQFDSVILKLLEKNSGAYHNIDSRGHQIILNYRATPRIARTVTLRQVLENQVERSFIQDKIVLIGTIDPSFQDHDWQTPYSRGQTAIKYMTGVEIQAHMVSQILSAVLDGRSLIWWWSKPGETLWIWVWSAVGGVSVLVWRPQLYQQLTGGAMLGLLYLSCLALLLKGGWIPLVSPALALVTTHGSAIAYSNFQNKQLNKKLQSSKI